MGAGIIDFKEELYNGPYLKQASDLVVLSAHGCDLKGKVNSPEVFGRTDLEGMHTQDDAFFITAVQFNATLFSKSKKSFLRPYKNVTQFYRHRCTEKRDNLDLRNA